MKDLSKINFAHLNEDNQTQLLINYKDIFLYSALTSQYENVRELAFLYGSNNCVSSSSINTAVIYLMANSNKEDLLIQILNYWKFKIDEESLKELSIRSNSEIRLAVAQNPDTPSYILNDMFKNACYYYVRCGNEEEINAVMHNPNFEIASAKNYAMEYILAEYSKDEQEKIFSKLNDAMELDDIFIEAIRDLIDKKIENEFVSILEDPNFYYNKGLEKMVIESFPDDYKWVIPKINHVLDSKN